jgi:uncharacterized alkaline shock family protein YloU
VTEPLVLGGSGGSITVTAGALNRLVVRAAEGVDGVSVRRPRRSVEVSHGEGRTTVSLGLAVRYGEVAPELARGVQERVTAALSASCGLEVDRVDVAVEAVV